MVAPPSQETRRKENRTPGRSESNQKGGLSVGKRIKGRPQVKEPHPLTKLIPERADQDSLAFEIAQSGVREPIVLYEGKVIEGRVRQRACISVDTQPQYKDWVLIAEGDVLDWMVRHHIQSHELTELELIALVASILPSYREMRGQTDKRIYDALDGRLSWNKVRTINWLEDAEALGPVLSGDKDVFEAARALGLAPDKREVALGKSYGAGDKFDEATQPLKRYLAAWKRKGNEFRHLNPKEASRRLSLIDSLIEDLEAIRPDLQKRSVSATYSAPPERKVTP